MNAVAEEGTKHDAGKVRWELLPWAALEEVAKVMTHGAKKYGDHNWLYVVSAKPRYFAAMMRHVVSYLGGDTHDKDSGLHHLAHAACCILFMLHFGLQDDISGRDGRL